MAGLTSRGKCPASATWTCEMTVGQEHPEALCMEMLRATAQAKTSHGRRVGGASLRSGVGGQKQGTEGEW